MNINRILKISFGLISTVLVFSLYMVKFSDVESNNIGIQLAGEIPEPATALLVAAGGIWLYRRKRRNR